MSDLPDQPDSPSSAPFERIKQQSAEGQEYWSARDLADVLGYTQWRNVEQAINRAIRACRNSGYDPVDHGADVSTMITVGKGGQRSVKDYWLSRYACYLVQPTPELSIQQLKAAERRRLKESGKRRQSPHRPLFPTDSPAPDESNS